MSDEGDRTCPLCAEEMDLTDQQLKPCKCGYEICVWCWHNIMNMAEKDDTEGRCPACRTPYNKEKIVGMAEKCERLVAEMNIEKKVKSQKAKGKPSEGRKQLSSVRVIQRNLVYVVGLPLTLADEDLLQRKEYFGQYGKVMKVSISRTAAGAIQHFANNTCSVYITYAKEDEAVRCIQSVHGFVLEGRSLRACFGTTKYCHAWLRSMPCSNPDCLYLHEIGSQEDSFTKDEIISAYTRVQQITGATNDMQPRSGNMLPPPADEYCDNGSASLGKPLDRSTTNNPAITVRVSPPNSSSGRSVALPAAASWGMRASNSQPASAILASSNGPSKQKLDTFTGSVAFSTAVASTTQVSVLHGDIGKKPNKESRTAQHKGKLEPLESVKQYMGADNWGAASETPTTPGFHATSTASGQFSTPLSKDKDKFTYMQPNITSSITLLGRDNGSSPEKDPSVATQGNIQNLCSEVSSLSIDKYQGLQQSDAEQFREPAYSVAAGRAATSSKDTCVTSALSDSRSDPQTQVDVSICEVEDDMRSFDDQRLKDPEVSTHINYSPNLSQSFYHSNGSSIYSPPQAYGSMDVNVDPQAVEKKLDKGLLPYTSSISVLSNEYSANLVSSSSDWDSTVEHSYLLPNEGRRNLVGRSETEVANAGLEMGESSIISNILSMDFDSWDESLTSPQNLAKFLGETDKQQGSLRVSSSRKAQNSNQSRFSFAREEESINQVSDVQPSLNNIGQAFTSRPFSHDFVNSRDFYLDKVGNSNGFSSLGADEHDNFAANHSHISSNKLSVSRSHISAPPGFSVPNRAPPPGFSSHERLEQTFDTLSGNHLFDTSLFRKPYQASVPVNIGSTGDIEFFDPAILAVGKGRLAGGLNSPSLDTRSNFPQQLSSFENEARIQLLMQRSLSPHQSQRYTEMGDGFAQRSDSYGIPSRIMDQNLTNNLSPFSQFTPSQSRNVSLSNGHWDGWNNDVQSGTDLGMAELLRNERLGYNNYYNGYEDSKFRMPSSADYYNRTFGI